MMRRWSAVVGALVASAVLEVVPLVANSEDAPAAGLKAGFAERDITPEIGMEAPGGYGKAYHQSIHDPSKVRASVFDDGQRRVAVVGIDALGIRRDSVQRVREAVEKQTGIPGDSILIGASHSHSSGPVVWIRRGEFDHASPQVQKLAYDESTLVDEKYLAHVEQSLIAAICEAHDRRVAVRAGAGVGQEGKVAFNRRFYMRNGRTVTHPGLGNPDIVEPAGPVDPQVGVIGVWDAQHPENLLGCVVNFACHATTSPGGASANYVYYLEKVIQGYFGPECVVVFVNGNSGDITQVDNQSPFQYPSGDRWAQFVGGRVGAEALKTLLTIEPGVLTPVAARTKSWSVARRTPSADRVRQAHELLARDKSQVDSVELTFAKETVLLEALLEKEPAVEVEVQVVQVGPVAFVSNPAEYFCQYGLEIREKSPFPLTFPVSLANGCVGYVPTTESFGPRGGGYETRLTSYSNLRITAGDEIRDASVELLGSFQPGPLVEPPRRVPFTGKPWAYGNLPPQRD